jgi:hypothetical protein
MLTSDSYEGKASSSCGQPFVEAEQARAWPSRSPENSTTSASGPAARSSPCTTLGRSAPRRCLASRCGCAPSIRPARTTFSESGWRPTLVGPFLLHFLTCALDQVPLTALGARAAFEPAADLGHAGLIDSLISALRTPRALTSARKQSRGRRQRRRHEPESLRARDETSARSPGSCGHARADADAVMWQ